MPRPGGPVPTGGSAPPPETDEEQDAEPTPQRQPRRERQVTEIERTALGGPVRANVPNEPAQDFDPNRGAEAVNAPPTSEKEQAQIVDEAFADLEGRSGPRPSPGSDTPRASQSRSLSTTGTPSLAPAAPEDGDGRLSAVPPGAPDPSSIADEERQDRIRGQRLAATGEQFGDVSGPLKDAERALDEATDTAADALRDLGESFEDSEAAARSPLGAQLAEGAANFAAGAVRTPSAAFEAAELTGYLAGGTRITGAEEGELGRRLDKLGAATQTALEATIEDARENPADFASELIVGGIVGGGLSRAARLAPDTSRRVAARDTVGQLADAVRQTDVRVNTRTRIGSGPGAFEFEFDGPRRSDSAEGDGDQLMLTREGSGDDPGDLTDAERAALEDMTLDEEALREEFADAPDEDARLADPAEPGELDELDAPDAFTPRPRRDLRDVTDVDTAPSQVQRGGGRFSLDRRTVDTLEEQDVADDLLDTSRDVDADATSDTADALAAATAGAAVADTDSLLEEVVGDTATDTDALTTADTAAVATPAALTEADTALTEPTATREPTTDLTEPDTALTQPTATRKPTAVTESAVTTDAELLRDPDRFRVPDPDRSRDRERAAEPPLGGDEFDRLFGTSARSRTFSTGISSGSNLDDLFGL